MIEMYKQANRAIYSPYEYGGEKRENSEQWEGRGGGGLRRKTQQDNDNDDDDHFDALDFLTQINIGTPYHFNPLSIIFHYSLHTTFLWCVPVCLSISVLCNAGLCVFQHCWINVSLFL